MFLKAPFKLHHLFWWPELVRHRISRSNSILLIPPQAFMRKYSFYRYFWRDHYKPGAPALFPWSRLHALTEGSLTGRGLCAEDRKIQIRHSGKRPSPSFRALKSRDSPGWMVKEPQNSVSSARSTLHSVPFSESSPTSILSSVKAVQLKSPTNYIRPMMKIEKYYLKHFIHVKSAFTSLGELSTFLSLREMSGRSQNKF